eukprot:XP_001694713.1 predicted protein [Chlamydomonas reinhardtii]
MNNEPAASCPGHKRRRSSSEEGEVPLPVPKKVSNAATEGAELASSLQVREQRRAEVKAIYANYGDLLNGGDTGAEALAFQGLLECRRGSLGARRLAARLATSGLDGSDLAAAMRRDALLGLGNVLETAVRQQQQAGGAGGAPAGAVAAERTVPVVTELVQFVLRQGGPLRSDATGPGCNGGADGGGAPGAGNASSAGAVLGRLPETQEWVRQLVGALLRGKNAPPEAGVAVPQQILAVQGRSPGMLLHMAAAAAPHHQQQQQQAGGQGQGQGQGVSDPLPPPNIRTLWFGQIHESLRDEDLLAACRQHGGEVVAWRFLRGSHCAFVDFATQAGADAARRALLSLRLGPSHQHVRVEWKLGYVVHSLYAHTPPAARALRRLVVSGSGGGGGSERSKLADFLGYLAEKKRAGVIKLEAAAGLPARTLYLVPPNEQVCSALGTEWTPREPFLLALVVPTAGAAGGNTARQRRRVAVAPPHLRHRTCDTVPATPQRQGCAAAGRSAHDRRASAADTGGLPSGLGLGCHLAPPWCRNGVVCGVLYATKGHYLYTPPLVLSNITLSPM